MVCAEHFAVMSHPTIESLAEDVTPSGFAQDVLGFEDYALDDAVAA